MYRKLLMLVVLPGLVILCNQTRDTEAQKSGQAVNYGWYSASAIFDFPAFQGGTSPQSSQQSQSKWRGNRGPQAGQRNQSYTSSPQERREGGRRGGEQGGRRRSWADIITTEELLNFLKEHESRLAEMMEKLKTENERFFTYQERTLKELYGPVIQQMKRDPVAGQRSLEKIRLRLRIQRSVFRVKRSAGDTKAKAEEELTGYVKELFEVILEQEKARVQRMEELQETRTEADKQQVRGDVRSRSRGRGEERSRRGGFDPDQFRRELDNRKEAIKDWEKDKDDIVKERVAELLRDRPSFPWGN